MFLGTAGLVLLAAAFFAAGCNYGVESTQPDYYEIYEVSGSAYERGYQHGEHFENKIRSLYTMLLVNAIYPYLNRDHPDVASVMLRYQDEERYGDGKFAYQMMLEAGYEFLKYMPQEYVDEIHGIADGSGMPFDEILILNTFFDTLMGFRSITFFIKLIQGPALWEVGWDGDLDLDGVDNDGDGDVDEPGEGWVQEYDPRSYATMTEVPPDAAIHFIIDDDKNGIDPDSVRVQVNEDEYQAPDPSIVVRPAGREGKTVEVIFTPPDGFPPASAVAVIIQCTDTTEVVRIPPHHPRSMRDERVTFTTLGYGKNTWEVPNRGYDDGRTVPPALGFAARGEATRTGELLVAHHFALLDSDTTHKHTLLMIHKPDDGEPFVTVGYTGVVWGLMGMNSAGLTFIQNTSDTLNSPFAEAFNEGLIFGNLLPKGIPIGMVCREVISKYQTVDQALEYLGQTEQTFGWNLLLADAGRRMTAVELDANIFDRPEGHMQIYGADAGEEENLDEHGLPYASLGPDDLRMASHFQKKVNEIWYNIVNFKIRPQRYWSTFYFRSVRAFFNLGDAIAARYGAIDLDAAIDILRQDNLVDPRDSMMAGVFLPEQRKLYFALGRVPATDAEFREFDLRAYLAQEVAP